MQQIRRLHNARHGQCVQQDGYIDEIQNTNNTYNNTVDINKSKSIKKLKNSPMMPTTSSLRLESRPTKRE